MNTRFETLYNLPSMLYSQNSPIIIVAGSLLKDTASSTVVAQLKYQCVSDKTISAFKIEILPMDVTMQISGEKVEYQYLDLNITNGQTFGSNKAIIMPRNTIRSYAIGDIMAVFSDGTQWSSTIEIFTVFQNDFFGSSFFPGSVFLPLYSADLLAIQFRSFDTFRGALVQVENFLLSLFKSNSNLCFRKVNCVLV